MIKGMLKNLSRKISDEQRSKLPYIRRDHGRGVLDSPPLPSKDDLFLNLPSFRDCPKNEREELLIRKLRLCCIVFDFSDESSEKDNQARELKRTILLDLVEFIVQKQIFTESVLEEIMNMLAANIFRALPPPHPNFDPEEDDPIYDPSWPHLQIVYEFLLRFIVSTDMDLKILKKYINPPFLLNFLDLFNSEDHRERDYLKTILHRIYGKFMSLRSFIRKAINNVFYRFMYERMSNNGIAELLEILGSIVNGFALPIKDEHKDFLLTVLVPLHQSLQLNHFHQQLSYCVTQFIEKDNKLSAPVMQGLLRYWPKTHSAKEVLFLNEMEEILELTPSDQFRVIVKPLFEQLSKSICSLHFQVAERALFLWDNEYIATLISDYRETILPLIFPALHKNSVKHWNETVHRVTLNVLKLFAEMDSELYEKCSKEYLAKIEAAKGDKRKQFWAKIEAQYANTKPRMG